MLRLRLTAGLRADGFAARFGFPLPARWRQRRARPARRAGDGGRGGHPA